MKHQHNQHATQKPEPPSVIKKKNKHSTAHRGRLLKPFLRMACGVKTYPCLKVQVEASLIMPNNGNESALRVVILDDDPLDVKLLQDALQASMNCRVTAVDSKPRYCSICGRSFPML